LANVTLFGFFRNYCATSLFSFVHSLFTTLRRRTDFSNVKKADAIGPVPVVLGMLIGYRSTVLNRIVRGLMRRLNNWLGALAGRLNAPEDAIQH